MPNTCQILSAEDKTVNRHITNRQNSMILWILQSGEETQKISEINEYNCSIYYL